MKYHELIAENILKVKIEKTQLSDRLESLFHLLKTETL